MEGEFLCYHFNSVWYLYKTVIKNPCKFDNSNAVQGGSTFVVLIFCWKNWKTCYHSSLVFIVSLDKTLSINYSLDFVGVILYSSQIQCIKYHEFRKVRLHIFRENQKIITIWEQILKINLKLKTLLRWALSNVII